MENTTATEAFPTDPLAAERARLLEAVLPHVAFDGWSETALAAAGRELGLDAATLEMLAPSGAAGLAALYHRRGDARMLRSLAAQDLEELRFRDRIARAVRLRLDQEDRELVRRGMALFALPHHAAEGTQLLWGTADSIWTALGDSSDDLSWYTKRLTLSGLYSAVVLYWLGDTSEGSAETWAFLDRRIEDVMRIEQAKAAARKAPLLGGLLKHPLNPLNHLKAPRRDTPDWRNSWPGRWQPDERGPGQTS